MNHYKAVCRSLRQKIVHRVEKEIDECQEEDSQIHIENINFINSNVRSPDIIAKLRTSSHQNSANFMYKIDMGSNSNICHLAQIP